MVALGAAVSFLLGSYMYFSFFFDPVPPRQVLSYGDVDILPASYEWHEPFAGGVLYKTRESPKKADPFDLGVIYGGPPALTPVQGVSPSGGYKVVLLDSDGNELWNGTDFNVPDGVVTRNGNYAMNASLIYPKSPGAAYGELSFSVIFNAFFEPSITASFPEVPQGGVFVIRLGGLQESPVISADAGLDADGNPIMAEFAKTGESSAEAVIAVAHDRPTGEYHVRVDCGASGWDVAYTVVEGSFERQNLNIDVSDPQITEANSPKAYAQYREKIYPLYETYDEERYWDGPFLRPVDWEASLCRISTTYGIFRYTNGGSAARRHPAMDIAAPTGTPVLAPNNGRVVMAEYLLNTGNTMVIEYGGGLKSYFFHLSSMAVNPGDMVSKGQEVAKVGSTGYSTGPHLHFEMRVGRQSLNPMPLMDGRSQLFF
jgi:murein DD-endopeptidase MepM/ murein hydrolase activator NlpD